MTRRNHVRADSRARRNGPRSPLAGARRRERSPLRFLLRFSGVWLAGAILMALVPAVEESAVRLTVLTSAWQAPALGLRAVVVGSDLFVSGARATVTPECTALLPSLILVSTIAAVPANAAQRLWAIATLLPAFWLFNQGRIGILMLTLAKRPEAFTFAHSVLWQAVSFVAIVGLVLVWTRGLRGHDS